MGSSRSLMGFRAVGGLGLWGLRVCGLGLYGGLGV